MRLTLVGWNVASKGHQSLGLGRLSARGCTRTSSVTPPNSGHVCTARWDSASRMTPVMPLWASAGSKRWKSSATPVSRRSHRRATQHGEGVGSGHPGAAGRSRRGPDRKVQALHGAARFVAAGDGGKKAEFVAVLEDNRRVAERLVERGAHGLCHANAEAAGSPWASSASRLADGAASGEDGSPFRAPAARADGRRTGATR